MSMATSILFLGYDREQTKLIEQMEARGALVEHTVEPVGDLSAFDLVFSFGYRHILSSEVLGTAKRPVLNLHLSYLPYNRGAHPNFWSFVDNTPPGVTLHELDAGIDTGPIVCQRLVNLSHERGATFASTYQQLLLEAEQLCIDFMERILSGAYTAEPQRGKGTFHRQADLPHFLTTWELEIDAFLKQHYQLVPNTQQRDMDLVDQIEGVRKNNNVNWMDLLRIGLKHAPAETKQILRRINSDDNKISELFRLLSE